MGSGQSRNISKEVEELREKAERLTVEKGQEMKSYYEKIQKIIADGNEILRENDIKTKGEKENLIARYEEKISALECQFREATSKIFEIIDENKEQNEKLVQGHKDEIRSLEAYYKRMIEQKEKELTIARKQALEIQKRGEERLDHQLDKHAELISSLQEDSFNKEKTLEDLRSYHISLLREVSQEKEKHLNDIKAYQKRLDEITKFSDGRTVFHHAYVLECPENHVLNRSEEFLEIVNKNIETNLEMNGMKIKDLNGT